MTQNKKYCAVYTRKSTEEGLDQEFNTLDAQREACMAYIMSQKAEGWEALDTQYDDGGYSGGNIERPALNSLLEDIKAGKVNIVVVYKIDRLTRSLTDFAKLVEIFDEHEVTFVSVTQSFNTTTSMGRLTLNILLSFAQFEREITGERIRDKIAASKKKGMWMGGVPPVGYDLANRQLVVNNEDTKTAQHIFERYLALGCVSALKKEIDDQGITSRVWISEKGNRLGGKPYSRGALYSLLQNPVYIGCIRHKQEIYEGEHEAIIPIELWEAVQTQLKQQASRPRGRESEKQPNLLKGLLFDCDGTQYSPSYTKKKGRQYRYYVSRNLLQDRDHPHAVMARLPAHTTEKVAWEAVREELPKLWPEDCETHAYVARHCDAIPVHVLLGTCLEKITISQAKMALRLSQAAMKKCLKDHLNVEAHCNDTSYDKEVPFKTDRGRRGALIIEPEGGHDPLDLSPQDLKKLVQGVIWCDEHFDGMPLKDIAAREQCSTAYVGTAIYKSLGINAPA